MGHRGRRRRRSNSNAWWKQEYGGMPVWGLLASIAALGIAVAVFVLPTMSSDAAPSARQTPRPPASMGPAPSPSAATPALELPAEPRLLVVGDSYSEGFAAEPQTQNGWAYLATEEIGWPSEIDGVGGTGFTWAGGTDNNGAGNFVTRLEAIVEDGSFVPNVLILQGGHNDWRATPAELSDAVADTVSLARESFDGVQVIVVGPVAGNGAFMTEVSSDLRRATVAAGAAYIDPLAEDWFDADSFDTMIIEDGTHLNNAGHRRFADRFTTDLRAVFGIDD